MSHDIDIVDPESGSLPRLAVTGDSADWYPLDWSPDDRKLLVLKSVSIAEAYLYVVDLCTGQRREVEPARPKWGSRGAKFSRDGQGVYLISDRDSEYSQLSYVNLFTGEKTVISGHFLGHRGAGDFPRRPLLGLRQQRGGVSKLNVLDLRTHQDLIPPKLPSAGIIGSLSFDAEGKRLAFGYPRANQPRDAYVLDIAANRTGGLDPSEAGPVDLDEVRDAAAGAVSDLRPERWQVAPDSGVRVRAGDSGAASGADHPARRPGIAIPARLRPLAAVRGE